MSIIPEVSFMSFVIIFQFYSVGVRKMSDMVFDLLFVVSIFFPPPCFSVCVLMYSEFLGGSCCFLF